MVKCCRVAWMTSGPKDQINPSIPGGFLQTINISFILWEKEIEFLYMKYFILFFNILYFFYLSADQIPVSITVCIFIIVLIMQHT